MRAAVTGGSGVVGSAVVRHLVAAGHEVFALSRSPESSETLAGLGAKTVHGDVLDRDSLLKLVDGTDWVFHIAGVNELCSCDPERMWQVNVDGTLLVAEACLSTGVQRLIHTSSAVTLGEEHGTVGSESSPHRGHFLSEYERSKTAAERLLLEGQRGLDIVSVNPSSVQGPGRSTGSAALLLEAARGRSPVLVDTVISLVDIDDCARGHIAAAERGVAGERYVLSGAVASVRRLVAIVNDHLDRLWHPWYVRKSVVMALAPLAQLIGRVTGVGIPLCPESARVLFNGHTYDGSRAHDELGLEYTQLEMTMDRTIDWFASEGLLDP